MNNKFKSESILYYPTIEFQKKSWYKSALCIWDDIDRIVPPSYNPKDDDEIKEAVQEGYIKNIILDDSDLELASDQFIKFSENLPFYPAGFTGTQYETRLHRDKLDQRLKKYFQSISGGFDRDGFYKIPSEMANGYMFFLAKSVSERRKIAKLTDNSDMFTVMSYFDSEGRFDEMLISESSEEEYTTMAIETLIPADIPYLSMEKIMKKNENLKNMKTEFRSAIKDFMEEIKDVQNKEFAEQKIMKFKMGLQEKSATWTEVMKMTFDNLVPAFIVSGVPAALAAATAMVASNDAVTTSVVAGGVYFTSVASIQKGADKVSKLWTPNKSNYYLQLRKDLTSPRKSTITYPNWNVLMDEFVND